MQEGAKKKLIFLIMSVLYFNKNNISLTLFRVITNMNRIILYNGFIHILFQNIYLFHFSDGDNWSGNDTNECMNLLDNTLLPASNLFSYGQVESRYGSGQFLKDLEKHYGEQNEKVIIHQIKDRDGIMNALRAFLGKGK